MFQHRRPCSTRSPTLTTLPPIAISNAPRLLNLRTQRRSQLPRSRSHLPPLTHHSQPQRYPAQLVFRVELRIRGEFPASKRVIEDMGGIGRVGRVVRSEPHDALDCGSAIVPCDGTSANRVYAAQNPRQEPDV